MISRRGLLLSAAALPAIAAKKALPRPNIVLVLADDLAAWMLGCYGNKEIRTPNIDLLARAGTRFQNHFVATPASSPSIATLFTGRLPRHHGIQDFLTDQPAANPPQGQASAPASFKDEVLLSDILAGQGYNCGYVGKWQMGNDAQPQHGFKFWQTVAGDNYQDPKLNIDGQQVQQKGYLAEILTQHACEFLDRQKPGNPFLLTVSHLNPHTPYEGHPEKYSKMYAATKFDTIGWEPPASNALRDKEMLKDIVGNIRRCAAAATALDDQLPPLLKRLTDRGLDDNTLFVFTSGSGFLLGRHGLWDSGLGSNPINMYDEVIATPMIWHWPGKIPVQAVRPEMVSACDFLLSVCEATGAPAPQNRRLCGRSYLPLALNQPLPKKHPWRNLVFGEYRNTQMVRDKRFKLVQRNQGQGPNELFDLQTDRGEKANQYDNPAFVAPRDQMTRQLQEWNKNYS